MNRIEQAVQLAEAIANDNRYGYSQPRRDWEFEDDCSTTVLGPLKKVGFDIGSATFTGNMLYPLLIIGFVDVIASVNPLTGNGLQRGDILLRPKTATRNGHTAFYIGNGQIVQANGDYDGVPGDSSGREITIQNYYNSPFTHVLRHPEASQQVGRVKSPFVTKFPAPSRFTVRQGKYYFGKDIAFNGRRYVKGELWLYDSAGYWIIGKYISGVDASKLTDM